MALPVGSRIEESWPADGLERVATCPYCDSTHRGLAYHDIRDWSFHCAPGQWTYWECRHCRALYLDPRPTKQTIGMAYTAYYTHAETGLSQLCSYGKSLVRNLCYLSWYGIDLRPRLLVPRFMWPLLSVFRRRIVAPSFIVQELNRLPKGRLIDLGCGNGLFLDTAQQLGWKALGIELDPEAVRVARAAGHEVVQGTDEVLAEFSGEIDCIICSHILEHVHDPKALLGRVCRALKTGGVALVSLPNAGSIVRRIVGENWRGLEAPRHLAIPNREQLIQLTCSLGFETTASFVSRLETLEASLDIARQRGIDTSGFCRDIEQYRDGRTRVAESESDFINVVLKKIAVPSRSAEAGHDGGGPSAGSHGAR